MNIKTPGKLPGVFVSSDFAYSVPPVFPLEADSEGYRNELRCNAFAEDVVETRFDEGIEAAERERCADAAIHAEFRLHVRVISSVDVELQSIDATTADQVRADAGSGQGINEIRVR